MKKYLRLLFFFTIILLFSDAILSQTWRKAVTQEFGGFDGIYFESATIGFCVGDSNSVKKTTDGGLTWTTKFKGPGSGSLKDVWFSDNNNGFAGGDNGLFVISTDGGENWAVNTVIGVTKSIRAVFFVDQNKGWVLSDAASGSVIMMTTDAGVTWSQVLATTNAMNDMYFSGTNGIAVGKTNADLFYTTDGTTWNQSQAVTLGGFNYTRSDIRGVYMVDSQTGYAVGWGSLVGLQPTIELKTTDGGATWEYLTQTEENRRYENFYCVWFKDANNGIAVGGGARGTAIIRTADGGQNWTPISIPCGATIYGIHGIGDNVWVAGNDGAILKSSDFGDTWELITNLPGVSVYAMQSVSDNIMYGGGYDGLFIKSTDNGKSWKGTYVNVNNVCSNIQGLFFLNENIGFVSRSYGMVCKTTDGGDTWNAVIPDTINTSATNYGVYFTDENNGFVVGKVASNEDIIYNTTDGGQTWDYKLNTLNANARAVAFGDANHGIVVAEKLNSVYTSDGGNTWNASTFNNVPSNLSSANLKDVAFSDAMNAIASGTEIILKTTDGGANWEYINMPDLTEDLGGVAFKGNSIGYAVGKKSSKPKNIGVYKTTDEGDTWTNIADTLVINTSENIYDIAIDKDGNPWVSCGSSTIYTTAGLTGINDDNNKLPVSFELSQNYPNPFNPTTKIKYSINAVGTSLTMLVQLKIYDVLGREVATLVNSVKSAGEYEVNFNAGNLSSGVFFYQLKAGDLQVTKKMILMR